MDKKVYLCLFCLIEKVLRPFQKLSALRREHLLIGVVFNQQKSYIRNLHLYDDAPAQGNFYSKY